MLNIRLQDVGVDHARAPRRKDPNLMFDVRVVGHPNTKLHRTWVSIMLELSGARTKSLHVLHTSPLGLLFLFVYGDSSI